MPFYLAASCGNKETLSFLVQTFLFAMLGSNPEFSAFLDLPPDYPFFLFFFERKNKSLTMMTGLALNSQSRWLFSKCWAYRCEPPFLAQIWFLVVCYIDFRNSCLYLLACRSNFLHFKTCWVLGTTGTWHESGQESLHGAPLTLEEVLAFIPAGPIGILTLYFRDGNWA